MRFHKVIEALLDALMASYHEFGGTARPPTMAIVDWRDVPTWTEFEILRDAFTAAGVPTIVCDPRELVFANGALTAQGTRIDLVYRRVLVNDILAKPDECRALVDACAARAVCMANSFRCKLAHKKAFFAVLTDPAHESLFSADERAIIQAHVPWTRVLDDVETQKGDWQGELLALARAWREHLVLKPNDEYGGKGVNLGWEMTEGQWDAALESALDDPVRHVDRAGADSGPARDLSPVRCDGPHQHERHAGGPRAVSLSRPDGRLPDAPERDRPRQRDVWRRAGAGLRGRVSCAIRSD